MELRSSDRAISPSLTMLFAHPISRQGAVSPSLLLDVQTSSGSSTKTADHVDEGSSVKSEHSGTLLRAECRRASRMARPSEPSAQARAQADARIQQIEAELKRTGLELAPVEAAPHSQSRSLAASSGKGPALQATNNDAQTQLALNHMASIKSKSLPTSSAHATWLLHGINAEPFYAALMGVALQSNAVNSSVTQRTKTQGAANQTSRINVKSTSQAAAAQVAAVALATAFGKKKAAQAGVSVKNPMGTCCVDVARLWASQHAEPQGLFAAALSSKLVFNACPTKLSADSIMSTARFLAENEVECMISERMGRADALDKLCAAIRSPGTTSLDVVWSSIVLIVYLCCHPRGRDLLSNTQLTDVDYHTASTLEAYGRAEITRRVRLDQLQATRHASPPKRARGVKKEDKGERKVAKEEEGEEGEEEEEEGEEEDDLQDFLDEEESAEAKILASKRKRGAKGCASASTSDSLGLLSWWYFALRSDEKSVLLSLVAHTKQAARDAAFQTLQKQTSSTPGVVQNEIIKGISEQNAVQSACALVPFVGRKVSEIPAALAWRWKNEIHCGLTRTHDEAHATTVHACSMLKASLQPKADTKIKVAWSQANMNFAPQSKAFSVFPAVTERLHEMIVYAATGLRQAVAASRMSAVTYADCMAPKTVDTSGIARSVISFAMRVDLSETVVLSGTQLAEELQAVHASARSAGCGEAGGGVGSSSNKFLAAESRDARARIEPLVSPSSVLGVGIALNEELKNWLSSPVQKSRKNNFTKVLLGSATQKQMSGPAPSIVDSEPLPLLTICDVHTHLESDTSQTEEAVVGVGLSVCGEGAVRVPEVAKALMANHAELGWVGAYRHARAVVFTASSQSSYISDVGARISASNANSAIQSSKKINVPDEHRVGFLSPLDCYVVGLPNVAVSHLGSGHMGAYGCPLDHGVSPPGLLAHNYRSDKRQHGNMTLSEQAANDLAQMFAEAHYVKCADGKTYCEAPIYARGIPHGLLPGIHSCLNDLVDALEVFRESTNRLDSATVDVVASLAFSPWTQAIAPTIEATADLSMRLCVRDPSLLSTGSGKAYLPDSTDPDRAIASPPLLEGPVQVSVADNPFSTSYGHIDSFFNAANTCVLLARTLAPKGQSAVAFLRATISAFVFGEAHCGRTHGPEHSFLAADALVLLSSMYPSEWCIAKPCLLPVWAKALPAVARMVSRQDAVETFVTLDQCVDDAHEVAAGREWWGRFAREDEELCAWSNGVGPLLQALDEHDGSYDVTKEKAGMMRERLETAVRAGFLANSVDGVAPPEDPCPAHTALSAAKVKRPHVDPTFVGDSRQGIVPKGCLVGLKPHQLRQVCALALGACLPDVEVQVSRNEGGLSLRVSSAADIVEHNGKQRTSKSISPVQTEADESAFGTRQDKLNGCVLQRRSWDDNARLLAPVFTAVSPPLPRAQRFRGEEGAAAKLSREGILLKKNQLQEHEHEAYARRAIEDAVTNDCF